MTDTTAITILVGIAIFSIAVPTLYWRLSGKPVTDETKLLRRIYALEQQVDNLNAQLADMEKLRAEVELLREENRRLLLSLSDYMMKSSEGDDIKTEIERVTKELERRRKTRDRVQQRLVTEPSSTGPGFLLDALRVEDKAIDELQNRLDMLRMARGAD